MPKILEIIKVDHISGQPVEWSIGFANSNEIPEPGILIEELTQQEIEENSRFGLNHKVEFKVIEVQKFTY